MVPRGPGRSMLPAAASLPGLLLSLLLVLSWEAREAEADIDCYTCGLRELCPLPFELDDDHEEQVAKAKEEQEEGDETEETTTEATAPQVKWQ